MQLAFGAASCIAGEAVPSEAIPFTKISRSLPEKWLTGRRNCIKYLVRLDNKLSLQFNFCGFTPHYICAKAKYCALAFTFNA